MPDDQYIHVVGSDLVRGADGRYLVLEDNLRSPSGVSYVLANRHDDDADLPRLVRRARRALRSTHYGGQLLENLAGSRRDAPSRARASGRPSSC